MYFLRFLIAVGCFVSVSSAVGVGAEIAPPKVSEKAAPAEGSASESKEKVESSTTPKMKRAQTSAILALPFLC